MVVYGTPWYKLSQLECVEFQYQVSDTVVAREALAFRAATCTTMNVTLLEQHSGGADILQRHGLREDPRLAGCAEGRRVRGQGAVHRAIVPDVLGLRSMRMG